MKNGKYYAATASLVYIKIFQELGDDPNDSASTISSNISLFTSSGSNSNAASLNNINHATTSTNHNEASSKPNCQNPEKPSSDLFSNNIPKCTNGSSEWDVKPQQAVPCSPSYSNTSVCSTDKNWNVHDSNTKNGVDDWSENESSLESTVTNSLSRDVSQFNGAKSGSSKAAPLKDSDAGSNYKKVGQKNERSPSVSSTESSCSLSKKMPPLKILKEHVIKLVRGNAAKKNNASLTNSKQSVSPTDENHTTLSPGLSTFSGKQEIVSRNSPHDDHNYVQPNRIVEAKHVNSNRSSFPISTGCTKLLKDSLNNAGISFTTTPNTKRLPVEATPPVTVPRNNNFAHRDVLEHLNNQNVTKSWNGVVNNNNSMNNNWHYKPYSSKLVNARDYDEYDAEMDRGRIKRRKSFDNRNYRVSNRNQFQEFYEGNKHNNYQPYRSNSYNGHGGRRYTQY